MAERIRLEITGDSKDLVQAAAAAAAAIRGVDHEVDRANRRSAVAVRGNASLGRSLMSVNRNATLLRNTIAAIRWPAMITGAGLAAQALSGAAAGAAALTGALAPLAGTLVALPALFGAAAQGALTLGLATTGVAAAVKAAIGEQQQAAKVATDTLGQQAAATERVRTAKLSLAAAQRQAKIAQEDLTSARKDARRELEDMREAVERGAATEARSKLSLQEAENELARLRREGGDANQLADARLRVKEAREELESTRTQVRRERADLAEADGRGGVRGMPQVVAARRQRADAVRSLTEAVRDLTRAEKEATDGATAQSAAAAKVASEFDKLPASGQRFARFLISLKPHLDDLRKVAADGLLPGAERGIRAALKNFAPLRNVIGLTADEMGDLAERAGDLVGSKAFGRDLETVGRRNAQTIERLGDAGLSWTNVLRDIMVEAGPFVGWMTKTVERLSAMASEEVRAARESGAIRDFFRETRQTLEVVGPMVWDFGRAIFNIVRLGKPLGDEILGALRDSAREFRQWTESASGKNTIRQYFEDARPLIFETGRLLGDITKAFFRLGTEKGAVDLVRSIRTEVLPALESLVSGMTQAFGPHIVDLVVSLAKTMEVLMGPTGALTVLVDLARMFSDVLRALLDTPGLGGFTANMITVAGVWKGLKWAGAVSAAERLSTLWKGIAASSAVTAVATGAGGAAVSRGPQAPKGGVATVAGDVGKGALGGAAAGGLLSKLAPLAKRAGLIGIGVSLLTGATSAFGDKSRQADFGGKLSNFLAGAIGVGAVDYAAKGRKIRDDILKGVEEEKPRTVPLAPRTTATREVDPEAGLNDKTKGQLDKLRRVRGQAESIFGKRVVLRVAVSGADLDRIEANFSRLKQGSDTSLKQLRETANANFKLLAQNLDLHSKTGQEAVSKNFRLAMRNVKRLLDDGVINTGQASREMRRLIETHSEGASAKLSDNFNRMESTIARTMRNAKGVTAEGMAAIKSLMADEMRAFGFTDAQIRRSLNLTAAGERRDPLTGKSPETLGGHQRGGPIFGGAPTGDSIPALLERDEYVLNRNAVKKVGRDVLDHINFGVAPRFQQGGFTGPHGSGAGFTPLANVLARQFGLQVTAGKDDHNLRTVSGNISDHSTGQAIDASNSADGQPTPQMDRAAQWIAHVLGHTSFSPPAVSGPPALKQEIYRTDAPGYGNHFDHIHIALQRLFAFSPERVAALIGGAGSGTMGNLGGLKVAGSGALPAIVQGAISAVRAAGQKRLEALAGSMPGVGGGGGAGFFPTGGKATDITGNGAALMKQISAKHGWNFADWWEIDRRESSHGTNLVNPTSTARLRGQFLDFNWGKYGPGSDPRVNPTMDQQIWSMAKYILARYGNPTAARQFHDAHNWYASGGLVNKLAYVGDSLGVGTIGPLRHLLPKVGINADVKVSRGSPEGANVLAGLLGKQHDAAVFDLGTNDENANVLRNSISKARASMHGRPLVMATVNGPDADHKNRMLRGMGGLNLVDWAGQFHGQLDSMGIHPGGAGYQQRAAMMAESIRHLSGQSGNANVPVGRGTPSESEIERQTKTVKKAREKLSGDKDSKKLKRQLREARDRLRTLKQRRKAGLGKQAKGQRRLDKRVASFALEDGFIRFVEGQRTKIEDDDADYGILEEQYRSDDVLTQAELDDLVARKSGIRGLVGGDDGASGGMVKLLRDIILPRLREKIDELRAFIARLRKRVEENVRKLKAKHARAKQLREAIEKVDKKKSPGKHERENRLRWQREMEQINQREIPALEADNSFVTGTTAGAFRNPADGSLLRSALGVLGTPGEAGGAEQLRDGTLYSQIAAVGQSLRPGALKTEWSAQNQVVVALLREGATKPSGDDGGSIADVMRQQRDDALRKAAISDARFDVFKGVAPLVGRFAQGTARVQATGLAVVHRDEAIIPDPSGAFGSQFAARSAPEVTVILEGDSARFLGDVKVMVDGQIAKHKENVEFRSRSLRRAPGRA
jgi:hypothetical protein